MALEISMNIKIVPVRLPAALWLTEMKMYVVKQHLVMMVKSLNFPSLRA